MRNIIQLLASFALLAAQAISPTAKLAATAQASAQVVDSHLEVSMNTKSVNAIEIKVPAKPDFDSEVLTPLRAAQAEAAAKAAAEMAARAEAARRAATVSARAKVATSTTSRTVIGQAPATPENMAKLRFCEAGGIYSRNSGNGYYGAYQFNIGTWGNWGGYARADLAPAEVQDQKFLETWSRRGWAPWPACSRKLGFM